MAFTEAYGRIVRLNEVTTKSRDTQSAFYDGKAWNLFNTRVQKGDSLRHR
jgi:hypothetical protein